MTTPRPLALALGLGAGLLSGHAFAQEPAPSAGAPAAAALTEDEQVAHLLRRFTLGASKSLFDAVRKEGWRAWFQRQLAGPAGASPVLTAKLKPYGSLNMDLAQIYWSYLPKNTKDTPLKERQQRQRRSNVPKQQALAGTLLHALYDDINPVRQASADFFRNHFSVDVQKGNLKYYIVTWERDVIQHHALGNFGALLDATARHPAMLFFLDNHLSRRPATNQELKKIKKKGKKSGNVAEAQAQLEIAQQRGLNENYARELLELHTLGVDNAYRQADVVEVAKCLTGWTIQSHKKMARGDVGFNFAANLHITGDKAFLGGRIRGNRKDPEAEGQQVLDHLKKHAGTAHFLAWKLCRWFVNDDPDPALVKRIAKVFLRTQGDIPAVLLAIVDDPAFFARTTIQSKFKRPFEYVISALRVTGADVTDVRGLEKALEDMNEPLYHCADPTGYYDQAEAWRDPGALAPRWAFANELVADRIRGVRLPASLYAGLPEDAPDAWVGILAERILPGGGCSAATARRIGVLVEQYKRELSAAAAAPRRGRRGPSGPERVARLIVAALLGSPDFQKQ